MISTLVLAACGAGHLDASDVGIVIDYAQGSNDHTHYTVVPPGEYYSTGVTQALFTYPIGQESLVMVKNATEGQQRGDDSVQCADQTGVIMHVDTTVLWRVNFDVNSHQGQVVELYQRRPQMPLLPTLDDKGKPTTDRDVQDQVVRPLARQAVVQACSHFTWGTINQHRGGGAGDFDGMVATFLQQSLAKEYLVLDGVALRNIYFEQAQLDQINQVQKAQAAAQAAAYAKQQAENEASASKVKTDQDAANIRELNAALSDSPVYLQYQAIEKWNGVDPQYVAGSGSSVPMVVAPATPTGK